MVFRRGQVVQKISTKILTYDRGLPVDVSDGPQVFGALRADGLQASKPRGSSSVSTSSILGIAVYLGVQHVSCFELTCCSCGGHMLFYHTLFPSSWEEISLGASMVISCVLGS